MDTRTALLNSAESLARSKGFDAFSYADLSEKVGIRKASIHHHFPTKADLGLELISRYREVFFVALGKIAARDVSAAVKLNAYLVLYRRALKGGAQVCLCVAFSAGRDSFDKGVLAELNAFHNESLTWLTSLFQEGRDDSSISGIKNPLSEARACLALVEGAQLMARAAKGIRQFDDAVSLLRSRAS
jgi:TetR/AcrR family transcriptional repressor of nem operon